VNILIEFCPSFGFSQAQLEIVPDDRTAARVDTIRQAKA
jgi:hypothetical protein